MKLREFFYAGDSIPEIAEDKYPAFYFQLEKAILKSLKDNGWLTGEQYERCLEELPYADR